MTNKLELSNEYKILSQAYSDMRGIVSHEDVKLRGKRKFLVKGYVSQEKWVSVLNLIQGAAATAFKLKMTSAQIMMTVSQLSIDIAKKGLYVDDSKVYFAFAKYFNACHTVQIEKGN